jgi:hypothetical protein
MSARRPSLRLIFLTIGCAIIAVACPLVVLVLDSTLVRALFPLAMLGLLLCSLRILWPPRQIGICENCGYNRRAIPRNARCPECGAPSKL